ncbi:MAG: DEAD/DEAH box helicase family protein [Bacteroidetes bacterium]|nr:DEAD/DEAH box helicase family protein [Bacteroidota bacterium]
MHETVASTLISSIRDNRERGSVGDFLNDKIIEGSKLSIVSAYFRIYAFNALKEKLWSIDSLRFLFGDPQFISAVTDATQKKTFQIKDESLALVNRLEQSRIARECSDWIKQKVEIRSISKKNFLHGKMYHVSNNGKDDAVIGSSNFTLRGIGLAASNNIELNLVIDSNRDRQDLIDWFNSIWTDQELTYDAKKEVLDYIEQLYRDYPPEFIYYKTLFHLFEKFLEGQEEAGLLNEVKQTLIDTQIWRTLFEFQRDGVRGAINKIIKHNGCIIADSVGLGKTYEALAIIKYFELKNDKVLVLCPKKLSDNWTVYQAHKHDVLNPLEKDRFGYTVMYHTDLSRESGHSSADNVNLQTFNWGAFDLIVIDESHNFRNNTPGKKDEEGNIIRKSRYQRLMDDIIKRGKKTKVLLLSATPVNNTLKDLRNQISIISGEEDAAFSNEDSIGLPSVSNTLKVAQRQFSEWAHKKGDKVSTELLNTLDSGFFKLLDELTIARSRKHVKKFYASEMARIGQFPDHAPVDSHYPEIDVKKKFLSYDALNDKILAYQLSMFNPSKYVLPEHKAEYEEKMLKRAGAGAVAFFKQADRENFLIGMMKVNFMKRLESSIFSFRETLKRAVDRMDDLIDRIERFKKHREENPDLDFDELNLDEMEDDELKEALEVGQKFVFKMHHLNVDAWAKALNSDRTQLHDLYLWAKDIEVPRDAKMKELKELIEKKVLHPTVDKDGKKNRKVLIFTAFADTAKYLYDSLHNWIHEDLKVHTALVMGGDENKSTYQPRGFKHQTEFNTILTHFSPVAKRREQVKNFPTDSEIEILFATDCISEGQNLQDCDYLINYDIHWNPVRIIQRFGRIDRIGSRNEKIHLVNFWATKDLDKYIKLKSRVESRMALVDISSTNSGNILNPEEIEELVAEDLRFRERQLKRLQKEVLDMDDLTDDGITLTDFSLDDFRMDLLRYLEANREDLENAPLGIYALTPAAATDQNLFSARATDVMQPGVIFCLRQIGDTNGNEKINPLQPYFLIYIFNSGDVRFSFTQSKMVLDIMRGVCTGRPDATKKLCDLFNQETKNGSDMQQYNQLLLKAISNIALTFKGRTEDFVFSGRGVKLPEENKQANNLNDFELITWLILK